MKQKHLNGSFRMYTDFIKHEYSLFMQKSGRYEEGWLGEDITLPETEPVIVYPSLSPKAERTILTLRQLGVKAKVLASNDTNIVIDYKTDAFKDPSIHKGQLSLYAKAMTEITGKKKQSLHCISKRFYGN